MTSCNCLLWNEYVETCGIFTKVETFKRRKRQTTNAKDRFNCIFVSFYLMGHFSSSLLFFIIVVPLNCLFLSPTIYFVLFASDCQSDGQSET